MAVKVGDVVHVLSWDNLNGDYADEFILTEIADDHLKLRHTAMYRQHSKYPGHGQIEERPLKYLEYFNTPLEGRMRGCEEWVEWFSNEVRIGR